MFELRLFHDRDKLEAVAIRCINCKKEIVLYLGTPKLEAVVTFFLFNAILHHVGMSWILCSNQIKRNMK